MVGRDISSSGQLVLKLVLATDDGHRSARQNVRRTDENGVPDSVSELLGLIDGSKLLPGRLVDADGVEDGRELVTIFGTVDVDGVSAEHLSLAGLLELKGNVLRKLATNGNDDTASRLKLVDIHDTLVRQLLEVEAVRHIVVTVRMLA